MDISTRVFISDVLYQFAIIVIGLLLAKYYTSFLTLKSKKRFLAFVSFGVVYFLAFKLNRVLLRKIDFGSFSVFIEIIIIAVIIYTLSSVLFKKNFGMQIFLLFSFLTVRDISATIVNTLCYLLALGSEMLRRFLVSNSILNIEQSIMFGVILGYLSSIIFSLAIITVIALALKRISKTFVYKNYTLRQSELLFLVLPCLSCLSVTNLIFIIQTLVDSSSLTALTDSLTINILVVMANLFFLFIVIASIKLLQKTIQLHIDEKNAEVFQNQIHQLQEQIHDVDNIYTEIRGMRHDMKNHLSNIQLLVKAAMEGNKDVSKELEEYLDKFGDTLNKFEFVYQTGNSVSDIIIHQRYLEAMNKEIDFSADFIYPVRLNLNVYDLAVILNNALENALEACISMAQPNRYIRVRSYVKGEMFFIEVENSFTGKIIFDEQTELPSSSKPDKVAHGIGISNIQRCARKYFGDIDIQISKGQKYSIFRLTIMLQGRA